jgi:hypothetical protein
LTGVEISAKTVLSRDTNENLQDGLETIAMNAGKGRNIN